MTFQSRSKLAFRIYPLRVVGMGLGGFVAGVVISERETSALTWLAVLLPSLVWPHVAYQWARRSKDPYRTEVRNLLIDSAIAAAFVPLMHFSPLPSVLLCTLTVIDKITTGIRGLWWKSGLAMLVGGLVVLPFTGAHFATSTSMAVVYACLPVLAIHTLLVSFVSYGLIRKLSAQNMLLKKMGSTDALTHLFSRSYWQRRSQAALALAHSEGLPSTMLMLDIDHFKHINDSLGHTTGDEVLRAVAKVVIRSVRPEDCASRFGGDEFTVLMPGLRKEDGIAVATRIRDAVQRIDMGDDSEIRLSCSIGVAQATEGYETLREWIDAADAALYDAKSKGRNRVSELAELREADIY